MPYKINYECISCGACMERCPTFAIHPVVNRYVVDETKCIDCGICADTCPYDHAVPSDSSLVVLPPRVFIIDEDKCLGCSLCQRACLVDAISGELRGKYTIDPDKCIGCGMCQARCRKDAIYYVGKPMADKPFSIDPDKCFVCGLCKVHCPAGAISGDLVPKFEVDLKRLFRVPFEIDASKCIRCGICVDWCKADAIEQACEELIESRRLVVAEKRSKRPSAFTEHALGV